MKISKKTIKKLKTVLSEICTNRINNAEIVLRSVIEKAEAKKQEHKSLMNFDFETIKPSEIELISKNLAEIMNMLNEIEVVKIPAIENVINGKEPEVKPKAGSKDIEISFKTIGGLLEKMHKQGVIKSYYLDLNADSKSHDLKISY